MREMSPAEIAIHNAIQELEKIDSDNRILGAIDFLSKAKELVSDSIDKKEDWFDKYSKFLDVDKIICVKKEHRFDIGVTYDLKIKVTKEKNYITDLWVYIYKDGNLKNGNRISKDRNFNCLKSFCTVAEYRNSIIESLL